MPFLDEDFLLQTEAARRLYHEYAEGEPLFDYHCHLSPEAIAEDAVFPDLAAAWLAGDHYKWRAMRANGIPESHITGGADPYEKFLAYCRTVPHCLRNPLYHWSHLELKRYFGMDLLINEETAPEIWEEANRQLKDPALSVRGILGRFDVRLVGTTDDPTASLEAHEAIRQAGLETKVVPTFRPDAGLRVDDSAGFMEWVTALANRTGMPVGSYGEYLEALRARHTAFHAAGGRASDHGLSICPRDTGTTPEVLDRVYRGALAGHAADPTEAEGFAFAVLSEVGRWNAERGWVMQFHVGAMRNTNTRQFDRLGPDTGFDSMGDWAHGERICRFLDHVEADGGLPKVILYNLNPADNYLFATLAGNFQDGSVPGKIQYGSGWWFLDQKEGIEWQLNALSNNGLLSRFIGMLTDSRSFLSFPRHEYFRRVLCNRVGQDMADGLIPEDDDLAGDLVRRICFRNAEAYFGFEEIDGEEAL